MLVDQQITSGLERLASAYDPDVDAALERVLGAEVGPGHDHRPPPRWVPVLAVAAVLVLVAGVALGAGPWLRHRTAQPADAPGGDWTQLPDSPLSARRDPVTVAVGDRFLVIGGWDGPACPPGADCAPSDTPALRDGAAYDPTTGRWTRLAQAPVPITAGSTCQVSASGS